MKPIPIHLIGPGGAGGGGPQGVKGPSALLVHGRIMSATMSTQVMGHDMGLIGVNIQCQDCRVVQNHNGPLCKFCSRPHGYPPKDLSSLLPGTYLGAMARNLAHHISSYKIDKEKFLRYMDQQINESIVQQVMES